MKDSKNKQKTSSKDFPTLTPYHWERSRAAGKAVEEMSKHPYSLEEVKAQIARKYTRKEKNKKKS